MTTATNDHQMRTIWKFPLGWGGNEPVVMPKGATILCVQLQDSIPTLWAMVNPDEPNETRDFQVIGTGWTFDSSCAQYIGTWQRDGFVWHLFERVSTPPSGERSDG